MAFKRSLLIVLLLAALLSADDSFANKDGKVVFAGKSCVATAKLTVKNKALSMEFKATGVGDKSIGVTLNFGECIVGASLMSTKNTQYLSFDGRAEDLFGFPVIAELSQTGFKAHVAKNRSRNYPQGCTPTFEADGDLQVIKVNVTLDAEADFFSIDFNDAKLYNGQYSTASILLIVAGSVGGLLVIVGSVGAIFWYIRREERKGKKDVAIKVSDKKAPIVSKPSHVSIQVDPPTPKIKPAPAKEKSKCKTVSQEQAPKRNATQEKATKSEATVEPAKEAPKPTKSLSQESFGTAQLITPDRIKTLSAYEDMPEIIPTFNSEETPLEPTLDDYRKRGPSILPRALVHVEYLPKDEFPSLGKLLRQETCERRYEIFFHPDLEQLAAELRRAETLVGHLYHARPGEMDFYWISDLYANLGDLDPIIKHVAEWKGSERQGNVRTGVEWLKRKQKKASEKGDKKAAETIGKQIWRLEFLIGTVEEQTIVDGALI